ncbi:MAG TPA: DUF1552 domain-containing protein, partial [Gammaproteobacteria bacterium]|nr:DUF1552 domain-containing protein [Gammaproteobacteria bacterium]
TLALPLLDAMVPAFASTIKQMPRLGFIYVPHGAIMSQWTPDTVGKSFQFKSAQPLEGFRYSSILEPLAAWRERIAVVSGLHHRAADSTAVHSLSPTTWLSGVRPKPTQGVDAYAGITADQFAAKVLGQDTMLPTMELGTEDHSSLIGACDRDYGCIYMNNISWHTHTTPLPIEINPRKVFERMFGDGGSVEEQLARRREDRSILDAVSQQTASLKIKLGAHDRGKLDQYLQSVREIEGRLQRAEAQVAANKDLVIPEAPPGIPFVYADHVGIMFDLMTLAYQANISRIQTFQMARELSNRTYPQVGVEEGHHAVSHHQNRADKMSMNARIQHYHVTLFTGLLKRLDAVQDGDGTLLDNTMLLYGSNMSNSNAHNHFPLPNFVVGGGMGRLKGGQHVKCPDHTPMTNLLLTMLHKADVPLEKLGDSTGTIAEL